MYYDCFIKMNPLTTFADISGAIINTNFESVALDIFRTQAHECEPYSRYLELLGVDASRVDNLAEVPFMPIEFFRTQRVYCAEHKEELVFSSSGTTGAETSHHYVASAELYQESFMAGFRQFLGDPSAYKLVTLLPSYRPGSSLLYMIDHLQRHCTGERVLLWGVTFALLEAARSGEMGVLPPGSIVIETGGMKGRAQEITTEELHRELCEGFGVERVASEYGMCELLSQAYSLGGGLFSPSQTMRVVGRSLTNPLNGAAIGQECGLNVIDLANRYSCSFLATGDGGVVYEDGTFRVLGRLQGEILRGCNML